MAEKEKFYITTAIAYTSRKPHIGNSYEIVLTDAIARYKRLPALLLRSMLTRYRAKSVKFATF